MSGSRFDELSKALASGSPRRTFLKILATAPIIGVLARVAVHEEPVLAQTLCPAAGSGPEAGGIIRTCDQFCRDFAAEANRVRFNATPITFNSTVVVNGTAALLINSSPVGLGSCQPGTPNYPYCEYKLCLEAAHNCQGPCFCSVAETCGSSPTNPNAGCNGVPGCQCAETAQGPMCFSGNVSCQQLISCNKNGSCPKGSICVLRTCCNRPVCFPLSLVCTPGQPAPSLPGPAPAPGQAPLDGPTPFGG